MGYPHFSSDCGEHHAVVKDMHGARPTIVVLCGSTRFGAAFREANLRLTFEGKIVLSIGCDMRSDREIFAGKTEAELATIKADLDVLHKRKIDLADEVYVLNVGGYIGSSTRSEIEYAVQHGKPVDYLVDPETVGIRELVRETYTSRGRIPAIRDYRAAIIPDPGLRKAQERVQAICAELVPGGES